MVGRSLGSLERELAMRRVERNRIVKKFNIQEQKRRIEKEISELKNPNVSRVKRGFKILAQKTSRGIMTQARLIKERQIKQEKSVRKSVGRRRRPQEFDPFDIGF